MIPYIHYWPTPSDENVVDLAFYKLHREVRAIDRLCRIADEAVAEWNAMKEADDEIGRVLESLKESGRE